MNECFIFLPVPGAGGRADSNGAWAGQPGGARFFFAAGARRVFLLRVRASLLTHLLPATSEHPLQKEIQGPRLVFFFAAGARAHSLRSTHSKTAPTTKRKTRVLPLFYVEISFCLDSTTFSIEMQASSTCRYMQVQGAFNNNPTK